MASFNAKFPVLQELFRKTTGGFPPAGRGLKLQETIVGHENRDFRVPLSGDNPGKNNGVPLPFSLIREQNCFYNDEQ